MFHGGILLAFLASSITVGFSFTAKAETSIDVSRFPDQYKFSQIITQSTGRQCPVKYSKESFRGRTGRVAFFNQWTKPVTVVIYHPSNGRVFSRNTVPPRQNHILVNGFVGDDWGMCFENLPNPTGFVNNLGQISEYNPNWQGSPLFMIQNPRIRW